jgi:peptidoglycan/xylan/chitin deacetylase (PgdA/CDA1 family)/cell division protein FtsB
MIKETYARGDDLQEDRVKETEQNAKGKDSAWHKRRIKRMKTAIVISFIILLLLPSIFCIILSFRISKLQNQVEKLLAIHESEIMLSVGSTDKDGNRAYAAELKAREEKGSEQEENLSDTQGQDGTKVKETGSGSSSEFESKPAQTEDQSSGSEAEGIPDQHGEAYGSSTEQEGNTRKEGNPSEIVNSDSTAEDKQLSPDTYSEEEINKEAAPAVEETINTKKGSDKAASKKDKAGESKTADKPEDGKVQIASTGIYAGKKVFLTFDDGPSAYTDEILDILDEYGVKATFFVIGKTDKESKRLYRRIIEEGHTLGMHSYSHVYKQIYNSIEDFDKDFTKLWKLLYDTTGYMPTIYRFPGGSANRVNKYGMDDFIRYLKDKNIIYYDWNVDNGDATGKKYSKEQLADNILKGVAAKKRSIVLLHDAEGKRTTVDSLPAVLEALLSGGAEVLPLTEDVAPIQQIKAEDMK